jgi:hypothetical protein
LGTSDGIIYTVTQVTVFRDGIIYTVTPVTEFHFLARGIFGLGVTVLSGRDSILPVTAFFSKSTVVALIAGGILD